MSEASVRRRFRLGATCLALVALSLVQQPGRMVADTKLDLAINPGGFLSRSLDLWDAEGFFGQVQNQAYGYLFPMGPFFWAGHAIQMPEWVVQRLWWALLLCVAFLGMVALCRAIGIGSLGVQIFAGLLFALSPRMLSVIGPSSIEVWPSAVAPWVLVPLVIGLQRGSPRRQAALSALAVACVGGVNAVATFAVIPLGAIWLLTAARGPRRRALMLWWPPFVLLGTLWWLAPLFLLGSVSPPFLDFIESSSVTTSAATVIDALRGTSDWVPYISSGAVAGKDVITNAAVVVNGGVVMILGVVGLVLAPARHRRFLVWGVLCGLLLVTLGHTGSVSGWWSGSVQAALDGVLAPLRNTHKFDVVIRIPLVIGAAYALTAAIDRGATAERTDVVRRAGAAALAVAALIGATAPAWTGQLANEGTFEVTPTYWQQTADYLEEQGVGTSLLVPSSGFGDYLWGRTGDELMQPIARSPWAVRNSIPLTPAGTIRYLDAITAELDQGRGSDGLAASLRRAGVGQLVIRNDLDPEVAGDRTELVHATLSNSSGLTKVATFGPELGGDPMIDLETERSFSQGGWQSTHPAVEIWQVDDAAGSASVQPLAETPTVVGGSDSLTVLDDLDLVGRRSVVLAQDQLATPTGPLVVTDGLRRQEAAFGRVDSLRSGSLTADDTYTLKRKVHDYLQPRDEPWTSVPELRGATKLEASSSRSAADSLVGLDPGAQPWSAFDGDDRSSWVANADSGWLRLRLGATRDLGTVRIVADAAPGEKVRLRVGTERGEVRRVAVGAQPVTVDVGRVDELRIDGATRSGGRPFAIADVTSPELSLSRPIVLPRTPRSWGSPDQVVLGVDQGGRPACVTVERLDRCRADTGSRSEDEVLIDREITTPATADYELEITTTPLAGPPADAFLQDGLPYFVSASSSAAADVRNSVSRVADGDRRTGWISEPGDTDPSIDVTWTSARTLSRISLATAPGLPASRVFAVTLELDDGTLRRVALEDGVGTFAPLRASHVVVHLKSESDARDFGTDGFPNLLPVGVSELTFGSRPATRPDRSFDPFTLPCGSGPSVEVHGRTHPTAVTTSYADVAAGNPARARTCSGEPVSLAEGVNRVTVKASNLFGTGRSVLTREGAQGSGSRGGDLVTRTQNANPGWDATADGRTAVPVTVNGWQRGWRLAGAGSTDLSETFTPNRSYRVALIVGAVTAATLLGLACVKGRRRPIADPQPAGRTGVVGLVAMIAVLGLVTGTVGVICAVAGAAIGMILARRQEVSAALIAAPLAAAVACYTWWAVAGGDVPVIPWRFPQLCAALSLGVVLGVLARRPGASDMNGRSTTL